MTPEQSINELELYAWVGEDELGSGEVGLKQAIVPAGIIPMVATKREKMDRFQIAIQLQKQATICGKVIRLVRFEAVEIVKELKP